MYTEIVFITIRTRNPDIAAIKYSTVRESMAEDKSSTGSTDAVPFPTLTILYIPEEAESIIKEISQKYYNITVEDCKGFFHGEYKDTIGRSRYGVRGSTHFGLMQSLQV